MIIARPRVILLRLGDVFRPLDEGQRQPVDTGIERGFQIGAILRRERGKRQYGLRQADALAVRKLAADLDLRRQTALLGGGAAQPHLAVVE
jgi:hypothetical protein